jgi:hypothetical protein
MMPKAGRKPLSAVEKNARGTLRPSRENMDGGDAASPVLGLRPAAELPYDVAIVWEEYAAPAVANGARQCDADSFAEWCTMTANLRQSRAAAGTVNAALPPASYLAQWRMLGEGFGLAGPRSRVGQPGPKQEDNPFNAFTRKRPD